MLPMIKINLKIITVVLVSTLINACGGGINVAGVGDGITGTGITAGRVTSLGVTKSIDVNGIKFNVNNVTKFKRDGISAGQRDFSLGEYVVINGLVNSAGTLGIAKEVVFNDLLEGAVTEVSTDNISIKILGQTVVIESNNVNESNNTTLLDDRDSGTATFVFNNLTDLVLGNIVEVSGVKDANGQINASSIKLKKESFVSGESENEIKGRVSNVNTMNKTFKIGAISVKYSDGVVFEGLTEQDLVNEPFVEVKSTSEIQGLILIASKIELEDEHIAVETGNKLEIEGVVTRFNTTLDFDVNGIPVTTNSGTDYKDGVASDIAWNTTLEVEGIVNSDGVLVAEKIEFED